MRRDLLSKLYDEVAHIAREGIFSKAMLGRL
jgi:hypothetical protein